MKKLYLILQLIAATLLLSPAVSGQCPGPYPNATQINWDNLDYYFNSGSNTAPYGFSTPSNGNYVTDAMEQTQKFAIGTATATFVTSNAGLVNPGAGVSAENATHTGNLTGYTGEDMQYNPSANGQSITITFNTPVWAPNFTLYDVDDDAVFTITATNNLNLPTIVNAVPQGSTILSIGIIPLIRTVSASNTALGNSSNQGSATITVPGAVNSITITVTTRGDDPVFWLSDINACVANAFPTNWHQLASNRPFVGPTQTMPDYFLVTPDNTSTYMLNPATGVARSLFVDAAKPYVNSFGYDPYNRFLYYISEGTAGNDYTNKAIKKYDYSTEPATISTVIADITAAPFNVPTFGSGVETAGCAFYNGSLYFGIEGGSYGSGGSTITRETIIYRIDFNGSNVPTSATQVFATNAGINGSNTSIHDWGDFIIRNGMIYNSNTARNSSNYSQSKYHHYNMMTANVDNVYTNPGTAVWNGQIGMTWAGGLYFFRPASSGSNSLVGLYNEDGTMGAGTTITVAAGAAWPGGAGDASDPFRPNCDFGDAPASYDPYSNPAIQSPAVHERADTMWIGNTTVEATSWNREFYKRGVNGTADSDNGVATVPFLPPGSSAYVVQASFYNNSSGNATAIAWLDFNGNGTFEAAEGAQVFPAGAPIAPSAAVVTRYFYWPSISTPLLAGATTYLRIRITATAAGMTTSHPTGYFTKGEVEDYRVPVDNYLLDTRLVNFDAALQNKKVQLNWTAVEETGTYSYEIERSADNLNWSAIGSVKAHNATGTFSYQSTDANPIKGHSFYRLRIIESAGMNRYSAVKAITFKEFSMQLAIAPNPAKDKTTLRIDVNESQEATIQILNMQGRVTSVKTQRLNTGLNTIEYPVEALGTGVYIVRVTAGNEIIHQKLIINK